jgi:hypothetical protein
MEASQVGLVEHHENIRTENMGTVLKLMLDRYKWVFCALEIFIDLPNCKWADSVFEFEYNNIFVVTKTLASGSYTKRIKYS